VAWWIFNCLHIKGNRSTPRGMLKKARLHTRPTPARRDAPIHGQGRSERRAEEVHTALRVGRSPFEWILANGRAHIVIPVSERLSSPYGKPLSEARTPHGKRRVSARRGRAGEKGDFFSILLVNRRGSV
jgi:hypothetical protein